MREGILAYGYCNTVKTPGQSNNYIKYLFYKIINLNPLSI